MADSQLEFSDTGIVGTAAELAGSATRIGLRIALLPLFALRDLPFGLGGGLGRASASFPRAVGKAFDSFANELAGIRDADSAADLDRPGVHPYRNDKKDADKKKEDSKDSADKKKEEKESKK